MMSEKELLFKCQKEVFLTETGFGLHHIDKHFGKMDSVTADIDRLFAENKSAVSHFVNDTTYLDNNDEPYTDMGYLEHMVGETIITDIQQRNKNKKATFLDTLEDLRNLEKKQLSFHLSGYESSIGIVLDEKNKRLYEKATEYAAIVFRRNYDAKEGFNIITAFPNMERGKETGRDITEDLHKTNVYKNGDLVDKAYLDCLISKKKVKPKRIGGKENPGLIYILKKNQEKTVSVILRNNDLTFKITKHDKTLKNRFLEQDLMDPKTWEHFEKVCPNFIKNSNIKQQREMLAHNLDLDKNGPKVDDDPFGRQ